MNITEKIGAVDITPTQRTKIAKALSLYALDVLTNTINDIDEDIIKNPEYSSLANELKGKDAAKHILGQVSKTGKPIALKKFITVSTQVGYYLCYLIKAAVTEMKDCAVPDTNAAIMQMKQHAYDHATECVIPFLVGYSDVMKETVEAMTFTPYGELDKILTELSNVIPCLDTRNRVVSLLYIFIRGFAYNVGISAAHQFMIDETRTRIDMHHLLMYYSVMNSNLAETDMMLTHETLLIMKEWYRMIELSRVKSNIVAATSDAGSEGSAEKND